MRTWLLLLIGQSTAALSLSGGIRPPLARKWRHASVPMNIDQSPLGERTEDDLSSEDLEECSVDVNTLSCRIRLLDSDLKAIDTQIEALKSEKRRKLDERRVTVNLYEELLFQVDRFGGQFNGPIIASVVAGVIIVFGKYFSDRYLEVVQSLYENDAYMEAGWLSESLKLALQIPGSFLADYQNAVDLAPLFTMAATSLVAYLVGDLVAQLVEGRRRPKLLDLGRSSRNALLGFILHGPLVYGWILVLEGPFAQQMQGSPLWLSLGLKILLDQTIFSALINLLYASLNAILKDCSPSEAAERARRLLVPAMVSSWRFWPAVQLISFSPLIPVDFKLLWIDTMEILWVAYLSTTANSAPAESPASDPGAGADEASDGQDLIPLGTVAVAVIAVLTALFWPALLVRVIDVEADSMLSGALGMQI